MLVLHGLIKMESELISLSREKYKSLPIERAREEGFESNIWKDEYIVANHPFIRQGWWHHVGIKEEELKIKGPIDFYFHIPSCFYRCKFCTRYYTRHNVPPEHKKEIVDGLIKELSIHTEERELVPNQTHSIYIGGGTPTSLDDADLFRLVRHLSKTLKHSSDVEFTIETDPIGLVLYKERARRLHDEGVNRISIGIQTLNDKVLNHCGREHTAGQALEAIESIRNAGFDKLNVDLMTGLPFQTLESWELTLRAIFNSGATCVTNYRMYLTPGAPFCYLGYNELNSPFKHERFLMDIMAVEFFKQRGIEEFPLRYFQFNEQQVARQTDRKFRGGSIIGIGKSAYSFFNNIISTNYYREDSYDIALGNGELPIGAGFRLDNEELKSRYAVLSIKWDGKIEKKEFEKKFGIPFGQAYPNQIEKLSSAGLIEENEDSISLTYLGRLLSERVAREFFTEIVKGSCEAIGMPGGAYDSKIAMGRFGL